MEVPDGYTKPVPESGTPLYFTILILPVHRCHEDAYEEIYRVPVIMSRN